MKKIFFVLLITLSVIVLSACATRRDQPPVINVPNLNPTIERGQSWNPLDGVTAEDPEDGNITDQIEVSGWDGDTDFIGTEEIVLSVTDSAGNTVRVTITLTVVAPAVPTPTPGEETPTPNDETPPPVYTQGPTISGHRSNITYFVGSGSLDLLDGVTAIDPIDGDITEDILILDSYDLETPGTYSVRLRVTNGGGIRTTVTVIINVVMPTVPQTFDTTTPITITMWHAMGQANTDLLNKYAASFMVLYPNVTVVIAESAGNYNTLRSNMINAITAGQYPNMVQGYPDHVAEYLNGRVVINLNPYITHPTHGLHGDDAFLDIIESYREENSQYDLDGTFYSLPFNKSTEVMIYNKTVLDELELNPPTTWQELIAMAPTLEAHAASKNTVDFVPAAYDSSGNMFITFTRQFGGAYTSFNYSTGRGNYLWVGNANTIAAMQFVKDLSPDFGSGILTLPDFWDQNYASTPFVNQQTYITFGSSAGVRYNIPSSATFEVGVAPIPYNADMPENRAVIQQGTNISLLTRGTAQEQLASWLFLKHLINVENTIDWAMNTGYLPVRTSAYLHPTYQAFLAGDGVTDRTALAISAAATAAYEQSNYFFYDPAFVGSSRARAQVGLALERILLGDGNIEAALQYAFNEANLGGS